MSPTPTANGINLPLDILENIIDSLAIAKSSHEKRHSTIKAFALVCHTTLPICRKHIFASIIVNGHVQSLTTSTFYELLTEYSHLAPYIRALNFRLVPSESQDRSQAGVSKIFQKLTKLQSITLRPTYFNESDWTPNREFLPLLHLPTITDLTFDSITNFPISDLIPCLSLKKLWVGGDLLIGGDSIPFPISDTQGSIIIEDFSWISCSRQGALTLSMVYHAQRTDGKLIFDFSKLRALYLSVRDLRPMEGLFGNCDLLKELKIRFCAVVPSMGLFEIFKGSLPTVEHLTLESHIDDTQPESCPDPFSGLCQELEKISAHNVISSLTIHIKAEVDDDYYPGYGWGALEKVLMIDGFAALTRVSISLTLEPVDALYWDTETLEDAVSLHFQALALIPTLEFSLEIEVDYP